MIETHFHCLPGVDDGPENWDAAVALCRAAAAEGTTTLIATATYACTKPFCTIERIRPPQTAPCATPSEAPSSTVWSFHFAARESASVQRTTVAL